MDIYIDILFLENVLINFFILMVTAKFSKTRTSSLRIFIGAVLGASYVIVLILLPGMKIYSTTIAKIILSMAIVAVTFSPERLKTFFKTLAMFYISTFICAGAAFAFLYFNQNGGFVRNGIVYVFWDSKWSTLILALGIAGIMVRIFYEIIQSRLIRDKLLLPLKISFENRIIELAALVDTGNSLHDPFTNTPVIVVEFYAIKDILPLEIQDIFKDSKDEDLISISDIVSRSKWFSRFRLIPFTSLGKENGMLIGFKPDYIEIGENETKKGVSDVVVGIYNKALSKNERYRALLSPELV
jgi:stage II sporulation protein GA (sporulation sigma-E factor processing peptidase)